MLQHVQMTQYVLSTIFLKIYALKDLLIISMIIVKVTIIFSFQILSFLEDVFIVDTKYG